MGFRGHTAQTFPSNHVTSSMLLCLTRRNVSPRHIPVTSKSTTLFTTNTRSYRVQNVDRNLTYPLDATCAWKLVADEQQRIDIWFENLDLPSYPMSVYATCLHWVEIKMKGLNVTRGARYWYCFFGLYYLLKYIFVSDFFRYCVDVNDTVEGFVKEAVVPVTQEKRVTSQSNEALVIFKSPDFFVRDEDVTTQHGFKLCYKLSAQV